MGGRWWKKCAKRSPRLNTLFAVNSLKYMEAGGRIGGAAAALLGGVLINIKPVCEFVQGEVRVVKPVIGRKRSIKAMVDEAVARIGNIDQTIIVLQKLSRLKMPIICCSISRIRRRKRCKSSAVP